MSSAESHRKAFEERYIKISKRQGKVRTMKASYIFVIIADWKTEHFKWKRISFKTEN